MSDSIVTRLAARGDEHVLAHEESCIEDLKAFGWLHGLREKAIMLELRFKTGDIACFAYSLLERADFDPSGGIILQFAGASIRIVGRHLNTEVRPSIRLFSGIIHHRVAWIQECDFGDADLPDGTAVVNEIVV